MDKAAQFSTSQFSGPTGEGYRVARQASYTPPRTLPEILVKKVAAVPWRGAAIGGVLGGGVGALHASQSNPESWSDYAAPVAIGAATGAGLGILADGPARDMVNNARDARGKRRNLNEVGDALADEVARLRKSRLDADWADRVEKAKAIRSEKDQEFIQKLRDQFPIPEHVPQAAGIPKVAPPQVIDAVGVDLPTKTSPRPRVAPPPVAHRAQEELTALLQDKNHVHEF